MTERDEEPLAGGIEGGRVVRVGDTVRRPAGPWTATSQALLAHLEAKSFPAPRPLGMDDKGREVVSWLPGRASNWPWPPGLLAPGGARRIGELLAAYHAAVADFAPATPVWRHGPEPIGPGRIALHGDFGPHNLIWTGEAISGVIDFELARPGRPMADAGFAVIRAAQLRPDEMTRPPGFETPPDRRQRLAAFAAGFGASPGSLVAAALAAQRDEIARIEQLGRRRRLEPWATFARRGLAETARAELAWLESHAALLA